MRYLAFLSSAIAIATVCCPVSTLAQSIIPAADGMGTVVTINGQTYTITGGTQSGDGANLFHSFQELGLNPHEIAQFLAQPQVQNILARVTGGNPSVIQGLIQVLGSNHPHLYLMNPAGIVFTPTATIDVPGSFTATTSDRLGFPGGEFAATGESDWATLNGTPQTFSFLSGNPGAIINQANLTAPNGDLNLIGGTVLNLGTLETPHGQITLAAVPAAKVLRISPVGSVLSIEIPLTTPYTTLDAASLSDLLQLPTLPSANQVQVNPDGTVSLSGSTMTLRAGDAIVAGTLKAKTIHLAAANRVVVPNPAQIITGEGADSAPTVTHFAQSADDPQTLIFLDALVDQYQTLLYAGKPGSTTVVVTPDQDGLATVSDALKPRKNVDAVHLVADGQVGEFWLGQSYVNAANVGQSQGQFQTWQASLSPHADVLLYSCYTALGIAGTNLVSAIAQATGADVAASTTLTGSAALGGDWQWEVQTGAIEAEVGFAADAIAAYDGLLDVFTANTVSELIAHMNTANSNGVADTIKLLANTTYNLTSIDNTGNGANGLPVIAPGTDLTIQGMGGSVVQRTGGPDFRLFQVGSNATFTLNNVTLSGGKTASGFTGGAISASTGATVNVVDSVITGNTAGYRGGAIYNYKGTLNITNSTIADNQAQAGGAIFNQGGASLVALTTINQSTLSGNKATGNGGAIYNNNDNSITVLLNSTLSGNSAMVRGGAVFQSYHADNLTITNSTVTNNNAVTGGGLHLQDGATTLNNSIVAGNVALSQDPDIFYNDDTYNPSLSISVSSNGHNLIGVLPATPSAMASSGDLTFASTGIADINEVLYPLDHYGGDTHTHLPRTYGIAIDRGNATGGREQRGGNRRVGPASDLGAVELQGFNLTVTGGGQSTTVGTSFPSPIQVEITELLSGQLFPDLVVSLSAPLFGASVTQPAQSESTNSAGRVSFPAIANGLPGTYNLLIRMADFPSSSQLITLTNLASNGDTSAGGNVLPVPGSTVSLDKTAIRNQVLPQLPSLPIGNTQGTATSSTIPVPPARLEQNISQIFLQHLGRAGELRVLTPQETTETLRRIATQAQINPVLIYAFFQPTTTSEASPTSPKNDPSKLPNHEVLWELTNTPYNLNREQFLGGSVNPQPTDELELVVLFDDGSVFRKRVPEATRSRTIAEMRRLRRTVQNINSQEGFLAPAQQLYEWLITPIADALTARKINNLSFILDQGLRSIPLAALHDGQQFIIEQYSVGIMPSLSLTNTTYTDLNRATVLGVGASTFTDQRPLPSVPLELELVTTQLGTGQALLNEKFTLANLQAVQTERSFDILHLATHGEFRAGELNNSYIQFWDQRLSLDELSQLGLENSAIKLLVLSACQTAVGDEDAELGFAGMAVLAGVQSVLGSLWSVSDAGTLGLMSAFYQELDRSTTKAEALRQAQLSLLHGDVRVNHGQLSTVRSEFPLPAAWSQMANSTLEHPYYWSAFTMIGSPW